MELEESSDRAPQFQVQDGEFDQFRIDRRFALLY